MESLEAAAFAVSDQLGKLGGRDQQASAGTAGTDSRGRDDALRDPATDRVGRSAGPFGDFFHGQVGLRLARNFAGQVIDLAVEQAQHRDDLFREIDRAWLDKLIDRDST